MAHRMTAVKTYGPRIDLNATLQTDTICELIEGRTALNTGEIRGMLIELHEALVDALAHGTPVKLDGLGIFIPAMRLDGSMHVALRPDPKLTRGLNAPGRPRCKIINRKSVGCTVDELIARWNAEHPEDPVG